MHRGNKTYQRQIEAEIREPCSYLEHASEFWLAYGLATELVDEDAAEIQTTRVSFRLIELHSLSDTRATHGSPLANSQIHLVSV